MDHHIYINQQIEAARLPSINHFLGTLPKLQLRDLPEEHQNCTICMEPFTDDASAEKPISLRCGHIFGSACLKTWASSLQVNPTCPMCRADLRPRSSIKQWELFAVLMQQEPYTSASQTLRRADGEHDSAVELVRLFFKVVLQMVTYHRRHRIRASALLLQSAQVVADRMGFLYVLLKEQIKIMNVLVPWGEEGPLVSTLLDSTFESFHEAAFERLELVERMVTSDLGINVGSPRVDGAVSVVSELFL